jgi:hypothetical protein
MKQVSVIIPFRGDVGTLRWALDGFARQRLPEDVSLDVRVGGDGCAPPEYAPTAGMSDSRIRFTFTSFPRGGVADTKNRLLEGINSDVLIFANADTRPEPGFVSAHVQRIFSLPSGTMVLGSSPYERLARRTVFDVLKEETSMIFFYERMEPHHFYDYRHAWNLNVSVRFGDFQHAGGFAAALRPYGYEDLDFAFKVMGEKAALYFDPDARVTHRHPMSLDEYLNREESLGCVVPNLARVNPRVFELLFGTRDLDYLARDFRIWTSMDAASHRWTYKRLVEWAPEPEGVLEEAGTAERKRLLLTLYQMHIPLKRLAFRLGFLRGLELMDDSRWLDRGSHGLWKQAIQ